MFISFPKRSVALFLCKPSWAVVWFLIALT